MHYFFYDIRFPDARHFRRETWNKFRKEDENCNKKYNWDSKANKIYWRGSTTGGRIESDSFKKLHRWRFVNFANNKNSTISTKANVAFSQISFCQKMACHGCYTDGCNTLKNSSIPPIDSHPFDAHWKYKVLMDLEGYGWSNRFKRLLYSNSVVFRHTTIFSEFWQDWVKPWVHYIPVKFDFSDVEEKLDRVIAGDNEMLSVIQPSTDLIKNELRIEDVYCYTYRLLLDYAKLLRYKVKPCQDKELLWKHRKSEVGW